MQQYENLKYPNLPDSDVVISAVGIKYKETIAALNKIGIKVYPVNENQNLPYYLNCHPDLNLIQFSKEILYCDNGIKIGELKDFFDISIIGEKSGQKYPFDCLLNAVIIGNKLICNEKSLSKNILNASYEAGFKIINVKQGYTKCSACIVNESCLITDDCSIYKSVQNYFDDILLISKGSVRLPGTNYGFIGGATGKIGKYKLAFNGRLDSHKDCNKIIDLLDKYKIEPIELINDMLTDIGSIIPLLQNVSNG